MESFLLFVILNLPPEYPCLIEGLSSSEYLVRENTSEKIESIIDDYPFLLTILEKHFDLEIKTRATRIKNKYLTTIKPTTYKVMPWIDCLPEFFPDRADLIIFYTSSYSHIPRDKDWTTYRYATSDLISDLFFKQQYQKKELIELLDRMVENEIIQRKKSNLGFPHGNK